MLLLCELEGRPFRIRDLGPADESGVLALFEASEDWFTAAFGQPAMPGDVQSLYYSLPEGADFEDKALLAIEAGGRILGLVDAVRNHPAPGACSVGLFLVHPDCRRLGLGRAVVAALLGSADGAACTEVSASIAEGWRPGLRFAEALGFTVAGTSGPAGGNRNLGPAERPTHRAVLRLRPTPPISRRRVVGPDR